jgi:hypothetical protein
VRKRKMAEGDRSMTSKISCGHKCFIWKDDPCRRGRDFGDYKIRYCQNFLEHGPDYLDGTKPIPAYFGFKKYESVDEARNDGWVFAHIWAYCPECVKNYCCSGGGLNHAKL